MPSQLAQTAAAAKDETAEPRTARDLVIAHQEEFARALGAQVEAEHFVRGALTALTSNPDLQVVTEQSLMASLLLAAQLKLEIGVGLNQFHLTPRKVKQKIKERKGDRDVVVERWVDVCVPIIGYQGFVTLAYRHPKVLDFQLAQRFERDGWSRTFTDDAGWRIRLEPLDAPRSERGAYMGSIVRTATAGGGVIATYLRVDEIEARRPDYTKEQEGQNGPYTPNTPWKTNYVAMGDKTVMREHSKMLPKSIELERALFLDGRVLKAADDGEIQTTMDLKDEFGEGAAEAEQAPPTEQRRPEQGQ